MPQGLPRKNLKPLVERITFTNTYLESLERGDILYFGYSGSREDTIIDPCIIFSGINPSTGYIEGVNMRLFYVDKAINYGVSSLAKYADVYWFEVENENEEEDLATFEKKRVNYNANNAFVYDKLDFYNTAVVTKVVKNSRKSVNLMKEYWRSYDPRKMRLLNDNFTRLGGGNISINLQTANVIINAAPKQVVIQPRIEA